MITAIWIGEQDPEVLSLLRDAFTPVPGADLIIPAGTAPSGEELARTEYILNGAGVLDEAVFSRAPNLKMVQRVGAGTDGIDFDAARRAGVTVANLPGANSVAVAELAVASLLACARHLPGLNTATHAGEWTPNRWLHSSIELSGKTAAIIGLGHIGRLLAARLTAFDMRLVYFDVFRQPPEVEEQLGIEFMALDDLLPLADVLSIHVPLTEETNGLIGAKQLAAMPTGSIVLNLSRAGIVDEEALAASLHSGHTAGAGLDVFTGEPNIAGHPLLDAPNVVATPHAGAQTRDTVSRVFSRAVENLLEHAAGRTPAHVID
ncbi:NAD(P)-dependent oxidoreductase [Brevibacterium luteolum]|uniref:3-phosphoglycerate dehydrogenase n=1 Tax=Brevibacterium luteolum TaxID=199591 RepID=A0A849AT71_9MICO|nr:NAD(P)-dependent oxidoreductase [Brevibacterium luteolum]MBM7528484.1 phosphoglycerate dehydrogenase-like enzyme [Brevibacterium luteolum]MCT1657306.1 hypothetical protein [Brevibacterium luteolum]NNG79311.1 3-phosphoglycerate dehydrogenase [Brevibacterium luteolum]